MTGLDSYKKGVIDGGEVRGDPFRLRDQLDDEVSLSELEMPLSFGHQTLLTAVEMSDELREYVIFDIVLVRVRLNLLPDP